MRARPALNRVHSHSAVISAEIVPYDVEDAKLA